jgi:hypothetical protein
MRHSLPTNAECFCALVRIPRASGNNALVFEMIERNFLDPARLRVNPRAMHRAIRVDLGLT